MDSYAPNHHGSLRASPVMTLTSPSSLQVGHMVLGLPQPPPQSAPWTAIAAKIQPVIRNYRLESPTAQDMTRWATPTVRGDNDSTRHPVSHEDMHFGSPPLTSLRGTSSVGKARAVETTVQEQQQQWQEGMSQGWWWYERYQQQQRQQHWLHQPHQQHQQWQRQRELHPTNRMHCQLRDAVCQDHHAGTFEAGIDEHFMTRSLAPVACSEHGQQSLYASADRSQTPVTPVQLPHEALCGTNSHISLRSAKCGSWSVNLNGIGETRHTSPVKNDAALRTKWKKARRKEQCRVNQARYRQRKRQHEMDLLRHIKELKTEIEELKDRKVRLKAHHPAHWPIGLTTDSIRVIGDFYLALTGPDQLQEPESVLHRRWFLLRLSGNPTLQSLLDLQRQDFTSVQDMQLHWLGYRQQFKHFQLRTVSFERLEVGDDVIIRVTGELRLHIDKQARDRRPGSHLEVRSTGACHYLVCPVRQQFEFEPGMHTLSRVTSETDLVAGVAATLRSTDPVHMLQALQEVERAFAVSIGARINV